MTEENNTETQSFILPDSGIINLKVLINYLGLERISELFDVLPDSTMYYKVGKLKTSLINLKELQRAMKELGIIKQPIIPAKPAPIILPPVPEPEKIPIDYVKKTASKKKSKTDFNKLRKIPLAVEMDIRGV